MNKFFVLLTLLSYSYATSVQYTDCGSQDGTISIVDVTPCSDPSDCGLQSGTTITVSITFTTKTKITSVNATVFGIIQGQTVPFLIPNTNGCVSSGLTCPLQSGLSFKYTTTVPVLSSYPLVPLIVRWELVDQNNVDLACFLLPAYIYS